MFNGMRFNVELRVSGEDDKRLPYVTLNELFAMIRNLQDGETIVISAVEE